MIDEDGQSVQQQARKNHLLQDHTMTRQLMGSHLLADVAGSPSSSSSDGCLTQASIVDGSVAPAFCASGLLWALLSPFGGTVSMLTGVAGDAALTADRHLQQL